MAANSRGMNTMSQTRDFRTLCAWACSCLLATTTLHQAVALDPFAEYEMTMYDRPAFATIPGNEVFPDVLLELWTRALQRPDAELQRMVIDSMTIAHQQGLSGVSTLRPKLREIVNAPDQNPELVRSAAHALIVLGRAEDGQLLGDIAIRYGGTVAQVIEPGLAKWKSTAMQAAWVERLRTPTTGASSLLLAMEGLGALKLDGAKETLVDWVTRPQAAVRLRLAAARALAQLNSDGLVELATKLRSSDVDAEPLTGILAIELLKEQTDTDAIELFQTLLDSPTLAVQSGALTQLQRISPDQVDVSIDRFASSRDVGLRFACARSMIATDKLTRIQTLASMLDDENPTLRREVAAGLVKLGSVPGLRDQVLSRVVAVLAQDSWRGCEQAAVVLAKLNHAPAGPRMVELLAHERGEVKVATAWGLTQLRIGELLPDMLERAQFVYDGFRTGKLNQSMPGLVDQITHLFIAMGDQRYSPAEPLMRAYLPKDISLGVHSRAAAAWALGMIHEDDPQEDLITVMLERLNDTQSLQPEMSEVRQMCAVSMGRMRAETAIASLRKNAGSEAIPSRACDWAIEQLTGESVPVFPSRQSEISGWFLSPIPTHAP